MTTVVRSYHLQPGHDPTIESDTVINIIIHMRNFL